jgi:hypothetical protein
MVGTFFGRSINHRVATTIFMTHRNLKNTFTHWHYVYSLIEEFVVTSSPINTETSLGMRKFI